MKLTLTTEKPEKISMPVKKRTAEEKLQQVIENYKEDPTHCPKCEGDDISSDAEEPEQNDDTGELTIQRNCQCDSCNFEWTETYTLKSVAFMYEDDNGFNKEKELFVQ